MFFFLLGVLPAVSAAVPPRVPSLQLATEVLVQLRQSAEQMGGAAKSWGVLLMCHGIEGKHTHGFQCIKPWIGLGILQAHVKKLILVLWGG